MKKPVVELARALLTVSRRDVMVGMYDSVERYPVQPC